MNIRRILYPTDFSPCAQQAFDTACSFARRYHAELHVLHALVLHAQEPYDPMFYLPASEQAYTAAAAAADEELQKLAAKAVAEGLPVVIAQRRDFQAAPAILDYASSEGVDLVVLGTHGRRGPARLLLGSVAEEVMRGAECPVLAVRQGNGESAASAAIHGILVPFDFSPAARRALSAAADVARRHGARLTVLHIVEQAVWPDVYGAAAAAQLAAERNRGLAEAELRLRLSAAELVSGVPCEVQVGSGRPATEIVSRAARPGIDLVVMASRGLTGVKRLLFGSTAEEVMRLATTPVMVVKPVEEGPEAKLAGQTMEAVGAPAGKH